VAIPTLKVVRNWLKDTLVREVNWDNLRQPIVKWGAQMRSNFYQIGKDCFGTSYDYTNDGSQSEDPCLKDQITAGVYKNEMYNTFAVSFTGAITWDGSDLIIPVGGLTITWRTGGNYITNVIPADTYSFTNGGAFIIFPHVTTGTALTEAVAYASIATGEFSKDIAAVNLNTDAQREEIIVFKRVGAILECPIINRSIQSGGKLTTSDLLYHTHEDDDDGGTLEWDNIFSALDAGDHTHGSGATYTPAYLTGGGSATAVIGTWTAVNDGSFDIDIDGASYTMSAIDFSGATSMDEVAELIQDEIRAETAALETCVWSTDHFVISSVDTSATSAVTVASASGVGTDISGAGGTTFMDCDVGNGTVTAKVVRSNEGGGLDWDVCWGDAVHSHEDDDEGGQLDWDDVWADAVHSHGDAAEGGTLTWVAALAAAGAGDHDHSGNTKGGTLTWANVLSAANAGNHDHSSNTTGSSISATAIGTGTLAVNRGGTGVTSSTGTGATVRNVSPTIDTPDIRGGLDGETAGGTTVVAITYVNYTTTGNSGWETIKSYTIADGTVKGVIAMGTIQASGSSQCEGHTMIGSAAAGTITTHDDRGMQSTIGSPANTQWSESGNTISFQVNSNAIGIVCRYEFHEFI